MLNYCGHTVHPRYLNDKSRVIDAGANYGNFSRLITERFGCRSYLIEADPHVCGTIKQTELIRPHAFAVSDREQTLIFRRNAQSTASLVVGTAGSAAANAAADANGGVGGGGTATLTAPETDGVSMRVPGRRLDTFVRELGWDGIDLLKMDIEGAEIPVIDSLSDDFLRSVGQIAIEFHDFLGLTPESEVRRILTRLRGLGFVAIKFTRVGHQDTWLLNTRLHSISKAELLWLEFGYRYFVGAKRLAWRLNNERKKRRGIAGSGQPVTAS